MESPEASQTNVIITKGIFTGLPTFAPSLSGFSAVVVGASGISGQHMLHVLSQSPKRWSKIYALSRSLPHIPDNTDDRIIHVPVDLLKGPEEIAAAIRGARVKADYVFFLAYLQPAPKPGASLWSNTDEMNAVNSDMLSSFLQSLLLTSLRPRRIVLQTGLKHYGTHLGPTSIPNMESTARLSSPPFPPNFYYKQEDLLFEFCRVHAPSTSWNVIRPSWVLGAVPDAAMNILYPLAIYAVVKQAMGESLDFPGDWDGWDKEQMQSSAMLNGYLSEWAALTAPAENQAFNASDGGAWTWGMFWPILAGWYGVPWNPPVMDESKYNAIETGPAPRGYGPPGKIRYSFSLVDWAQRPEVQAAWARIAKQHSITANPFKDLERIWSPTHLALVTPWAMSVRMDKARKMGWHGYVDTLEVVMETFERFAELKMIPPVPFLSRTDERSIHLG